MKTWEKTEGIIMVDLGTVSIVVASASVVVGVVYYAWEIRNQNRMRQIDLTVRLSQQFTAKEFIESWGLAMTREEKDLKEYTKKYGLTELFQISTFFESIGFLLHRKFLDNDVAVELWAEPVIMMWEKYGTMLKQLHSDKCFWFEYLNNELKRKKATATSSKILT